VFEHSLIDLEAKQQPQRRRWLSLPLAIALHLVALTAFAFASYWNVGPVQEPQTNVAFIDVVLPPPPPAGGGGHPAPPPPADRPPTTPRQENTQVQQPQDVPNKPPAPDPPTQVDVPPGPAVDGPVTPGPGDHPGPGPGIDPGPPGPSVIPGGGDETLPQRLTAAMTRPQALRPIQPHYTETARRVGMEGTVILEAIIDEKGNATNVRILRGLPMGLDRAAMEAIQQTPFKPAMIGNRPVKVYFTLTVNFTIQR
jgi:protein TonB